MNPDISPLTVSLAHFLPELLLAALFLIMAALRLLRPGLPVRVFAVLALVGLIGAGCLIVVTQLPLILDGAAVRGEAMSTFHAEWIFKGSAQPHGLGMIMIDGVGLFFKGIVLVAAIIAVIVALLSEELRRRAGERVGSYLALLVLLSCMLFVMCGANDLLAMYVAVEIASLAAYALISVTRDIPRTAEASMKYLIFGAVATGVMLFGISLLYGLVGTMNFAELGIILGARNTENALANPLVIASIMIAGGLAWKIAAAPLHFWAPDVMEGAPVAAGGFLAVAVKGGAVVIAIRFIAVVYPGMMQGFDWTPLLGGMAVLTMSLGNLAAMQQTNMKRLLGYLSVAQGGYMLLGLAAGTTAGIAAILIAFAAYLAAMFGAFFAVQKIAEFTGSEEIEDMRGMGPRMPLFGLAFIVSLISLVGLPPTGGFTGRLYLFTALVDAGPQYLWLAVVAAVNILLSLYTVTRILKSLYLEKGSEERTRLCVGSAARVLAGAIACITLLLGVPGFSGSLVQVADEAVKGLAPYLREPAEAGRPL